MDTREGTTVDRIVAQAMKDKFRSGPQDVINWIELADAAIAAHLKALAAKGWAVVSKVALDSVSNELGPIDMLPAMIQEVDNG